jgi:hypothetical protein
MTKYFIYDADYLESIRSSNKLLFCCICDYILEYPVCCYECQNIMCLACVKSINHNCTDVPTSSKHSINGNPLQQIYLSKLNVQCALNRKNGCKWKGTRDAYTFHITECETIYSKCEFCDAFINKNSTEHYDNHCSSYKKWILTSAPDTKIAAYIKHLLNHNEANQKQIKFFENQINALEKNVASLKSSHNIYAKRHTKLDSTVLQQNQRLLNLEHYDRLELKVTKSFDIAKIIRDHQNIWKNSSLYNNLNYGIFFSIASVTLPSGVWDIFDCSALDNIINSKLVNKLNEMRLCTNKHGNHCYQSRNCVNCANNKCSMGCINIKSIVITYRNHPKEIFDRFKDGRYLNSYGNDLNCADPHNINVSSTYDDQNRQINHPILMENLLYTNRNIPFDNSDSYYSEICIGLTIAINKRKVVKIIADNTDKYVVDAGLCKSRIIAQRIA